MGDLRVPGHPGPVLPHPIRRLNFGDRQQGWNTAVPRAAAETHLPTAGPRRRRAAPRTEAVRGGRGRKCLRRTFRRAGRRAEIQGRATPALSPPEPAGPAPRPPQDTYGLAGCLCWGPRARGLHPAALEAACGLGAPEGPRDRTASPPQPRMMFLMCSWNWFTGILLAIFTSISVRKIGLIFSSFVESLCLGIRVHRMSLSMFLCFYVLE